MSSEKHPQAWGFLGRSVARSDRRTAGLQRPGVEQAENWFSSATPDEIQAVARDSRCATRLLVNANRSAQDIRVRDLEWVKERCALVERQAEAFEGLHHDFVRPAARQTTNSAQLRGWRHLHRSFSASSFAYTLPGLTAKAASLVVGYWAALPFVHLATGHGFGFKKKRTGATGCSGVDVQRCDAGSAVEQFSQAQIEVAPGVDAVSASRTPSSPSN